MINLAIMLALSSDPTIVDESKLKMFNNRFVAESAANERQGLFVIKSPKGGLPVFDKAIAYVKDLTPEFVARKNADGTFTAWNLNGSPRALKEDDITSEEAKGFWPGEPQLKVTRPPEASTRLSFDHHFIAQGEIYSSLGLSKNTFTAWCHLGKPKSAFVNVPFRDKVRLEMGTFEPLEGTKKVIDGIPFEINAVTQIVGYTQKAVYIQQGKVDPQGEYGFEVKIDSDRFKKDHPEANPRSRTSFQANSSSGLPNNIYCQFRITDGRPDDYWTGLSVYRTSTIVGYFGHVPTAPFSDQ